MATMNVAIEVSTWRARLWVRAMQALAPFVGSDRALRWAVEGAQKRMRYRVAGARKWSRL